MVLVAQQLSAYQVDSATQVQNLNKAICISHSANTLEKGMNPFFPLQ